MGRNIPEGARGFRVGLSGVMSAVSMQIRRLEDMTGVQVPDRSARRVSRAEAGEQVLTCARRIVTLDDEALGRLTHASHEGKIVLGVQAALDRAGIPWEIAVVSQNTRSVEATVSADLAVHTALAGSEPRHVERITHGGALPELSRMKIGLYTSRSADAPHLALAEMLRQAFAGHGAARAQPLATAAA